MELIDIIEEYNYHCLAKGFTKKTIINQNIPNSCRLHHFNGLIIFTD
ncbi:hypothetical protein [Peribacillus muralis]